MATRTDYLELRAEALAALAEVLHIADSSKESASALEKAIRLYEQKGNVVAAERGSSRLAEPQPGPA